MNSFCSSQKYYLTWLNQNASYNTLGYNKNLFLKVRWGRNKSSWKVWQWQWSPTRTLSDINTHHTRLQTQQHRSVPDIHSWPQTWQQSSVHDTVSPSGCILHAFKGCGHNQSWQPPSFDFWCTSGYESISRNHFYTNDTRELAAHNYHSS